MITVKMAGGKKRECKRATERERETREKESIVRNVKVTDSDQIVESKAAFWDR